ncbi:hypothetical protein EOS_35815 [Caballeronia mineralivorans PML1(12)]|uniref:PBS lyase n=2 Tax=Caballeronia mineralivorans TaxID=2010198 RepID=A0A0J1CM20_9BURK|nr:hypothetical protein EOS_35815 [Caballeronia mineralivorans PML1(12)]
MATRAKNLWLEVHALWLLGDTDGGHAQGRYPGAIGELPPRGRAKVLSIIASHLEQLPPSKRQRAFDRALGATFSLSPDYQGRPLVALAQALEIVGDQPATEFGKLVDAVGTLPDGAYAGLLLAALADNLELLAARDRITMFGRLLTATEELRCRNENRPFVLPMKHLGYAFGKLPDKARKEEMNRLFEIVNALPCDDRVQALVELVFNFPAKGDDWAGARLDTVLKIIEGLPSRSRIRPLTALSNTISLLRVAGSARATHLVLDTIQELEPRDVTIDLIASLSISAAIEDLPLSDRPAMFDRLLAVTSRLLDGDPAWSAEQIRSAELPLRRLCRVVVWLPVNLWETAQSDLFSVGCLLADSYRDSFLSDLSGQA